MGKFYMFFLALLWTNLCANGTTTQNPRKSIFKSVPDKQNRVLVGKSIQLDWSFKFHSADDLRRIMLFSYELTSKAKTTIASKDVKSGEFKYNPFLAGNNRRYVCKISYEKNGVGKASILIPNVQFNHRYDYGISLQMTEAHLRAEENSVSVKVVDMVRGGNKKDVKIIRSWFGQKVLLKCDVIHHNNIRPLFKWSRKSLTETIEEDLLAPNTTRTLIIKKVNYTDFGEYTCEAKSDMVTVEQKFQVAKLGYAGSPRNVDYTYYPKSGSYALYWEQPSANDVHWVKKYVLQEWKADKNIWTNPKNITTLHVTIKNIESTTKYRVCSANEIGYAESSCSESVTLAKTSKVTKKPEGASSRFWPSQHLILVMTLLSGIIVRHE